MPPPKDPIKKEEWKKNLSKAGIGKKRHNTPDYWRKSLSQSKIGKKRPPFSEEWKRNIAKNSIFQKGKIPWNKGMVGEKSATWKGGLSYLPYSLDWTESLRRTIRERDHYACQLCGKPQGDIAHDVHHIDYDKLNCNPNNLITICKKCHP